LDLPPGEIACVEAVQVVGEALGHVWIEGAVWPERVVGAGGSGRVGGDDRRGDVVEEMIG
jgi:hypothetical protein